MEAHEVIKLERNMIKNIIESAYVRGLRMGMIIMGIVGIITIIIIK